MKKYTVLSLLLVLCMLLAMTGCASHDVKEAASSSYYDDGYYYYEEAKEEPAMAMDEAEWGGYDYDYDYPEAEEGYGTEPTSSDADDVEYEQTVSDFTAKIIYTASMYIESTDFDSSVASLERAVADIGGFVENSNVSGNTVYNSDGTTRVVDRYAYYTVRVPAARFENFLKQSSNLGSILNTSRNAENVTSRYTDYEARLSSLTTQETRLLAMLDKAEDVDTLVALEERLCDVRYEIESIERNLRNLDMEISYSTVDITIQEVEIYTPTAPVTRTFGEKINDAFSDAWAGFARGFQYFIIDLVSALPTLLILAVVIVVIIFVVKAILKKSRAKKAAKKTSAPASPFVPAAKAAPAAPAPAAPAAPAAPVAPAPAAPAPAPAAQPQEPKKP